MRGNRYSLPEAWCGRQVTVRITLDDELRVYGNDELIARHQLSPATAGWQTVPEHHQALLQRTCQVEQRPLDAYGDYSDERTVKPADPAENGPSERRGGKPSGAGHERRAELP